MYPQLSLYIDGQMLRGEGRREQGGWDCDNREVSGQRSQVRRAGRDVGMAAVGSVGV